MQIFYKLKVSNALRMIIRHFLFGKQKQPIVIQPKSIHVLIIKSGISASNTNGIKKLNNNKSTPNSTTPKRSGRINGFVANNLSFSHCNTNDKTNPTKTTQVVSRVMRKFNFGIWQKSITGGASAPLDYISAVRAQRVKGGVSRSSCP